MAGESNTFDDQVTINVADGDSVQVEIADDTPETDRGRPRRPDGHKPEVPEDDEIKKYSEGVQKRIKTLKWEFHEERREKEAAQRERDAAVEFAKRAQVEIEQAKKIRQASENAMIEQAKLRVKAEKDRLQRDLENATNTGDHLKIANIMADLGRYGAEEHQLNGYVTQRDEPAPQRQQQQQQQQQQTQVDPRAVEWARKNPWFGTDEEMTSFAYGLHNKLVKSGVHPLSEDYWPAVDARMREKFPEQFADQEETIEEEKPHPRVVPANRRSGGSGSPKKVTLTASQVALAKRLGLTPQQYGAQLLKEQSK